MEDTLQIIEDVNSLNTLLTEAATNQRNMDDQKYKALKMNLACIPRIQPLLPTFLKSSSTLSSFRTLAQKERPKWEQRRDFIDKAFETLENSLNDELRSPLGAPLTDMLTKVDTPHVAIACQKALDRVNDDPDGAITSARSLLETVCKHILDEQGATYSRTADLPDLYRSAIRVMELAPDQQSESDIRQMLQGCVSVVQGLGALRNRIGDAHGKNAVAGTVKKHHALLGVGVACSVATFLITAWEIHNADAGQQISHTATVV